MSMQKSTAAPEEKAMQEDRKALTEKHLLTSSYKHVHPANSLELVWQIAESFKILSRFNFVELCQLSKS